MPDAPKRPNLSAVLELVHRSGGLTRADLTASTGLNRSSVAAIVADLVALGLVIEREPSPVARVGRPSPLVVPDPAVVAIAVNPEVDAVTLGVVGLAAAVQHRHRHVTATPPSPEEVAALVGEYAAAHTTGRRVVGIGVAVPGLVDEPAGVVRWAPHLGWRDVRLGELLGAATGLRSRVANDASLGALAEHSWGAGRGIDDLVYLNGGASGIGGGVIAGGRLLGGVSGFAGEFGHNLLRVADADRRSDSSEFEQEVSRDRLLAALGLRDADEVELAALVSAAEGPAREETERQRRVLVVALANAVNVLNPARIILGGFLAGIAGDDPSALAAETGRHSVAESAERLEVVRAGLGEDRLLIGAAELPLARLLAAPTAR